MTIRSSTRGAFAGAVAALGAVTDSEATGFLPEGYRCEEAAINEGFGEIPRTRLEAERGGQARDGSESEGREADHESEEDDGLGLRREAAEDSRGDDDRLRRESAEEAADGDQEEDAEG